jgi:Domain of unknown function (DUF4326)
MMKIVNLRECGFDGLRRMNGVYCGRGSVLGNRFRIGVDGDREEVIRKFRAWLWERMECGDERVIEAMSGLNANSVLGCWCSPLPCHCEVIERAWNYYYGG